MEELYAVRVDPASFAVGDPPNSQSVKVVDLEDLIQAPPWFVQFSINS